jgi:hypothetical protein
MMCVAPHSKMNAANIIGTHANRVIERRRVKE